MNRPVVLVTSTKLAQDAQRILREGGTDIVFLPDPIDEDSLTAALARTQAEAVLMRGNPPFTRRVIEAGTKLRVIAKHGAGVDSVDLTAATERGIAVMTAGAANADAVAELTLALMLALARELPRLDRGVKRGLWERPNFQGREFRGRTVGIVGYGQIGRRVAQLALAFGTRVVVHSRSPIADAQGAEVETELDALLRRVDVLSLHCPLTEQTRGMIGARELRSMKPGAVLVNTARGALVDEIALAQALNSGQLAGAGLDTYAAEPPAADYPLFALDNVLCTPHIAGATQESLARVGAVAAVNIIRHLQGEAPDAGNLANPAVLRH